MTPFITLTRVGSTAIVRVNALQIAYLQEHGAGSVVLFGSGSHIHAAQSTARIEALVEAALSGREPPEEDTAGADAEDLDGEELDDGDRYEDGDDHDDDHDGDGNGDADGGASAGGPAPADPAANASAPRRSRGGGGQRRTAPAAGDAV